MAAEGIAGRDWIEGVRYGVDLLGSASPVSRRAGVSVITELAESSGGVRRQRAVGVLCAYLRASRPFDEDVAAAIWQEIRAHCLPDDGSWSDVHLDLRGHVAPGRLDLADTRIGSIDLSGARLGDVDCCRTTISGLADFTLAEFALGLFEDAAFERGKFDAARITASAQFERARFSQASFVGADFGGVANFQDSVFERPPDFRAATLRVPIFGGAQGLAKEDPDFGPIYWGEARFDRTGSSMLNLFGGNDLPPGAQWLPVESPQESDAG